MKILHVIYSLDPRLGGPPMVVVRLAASQVANGHQVAIAYGLDPDSPYSIEPLIDGVPYVDQVRFQSYAVPDNWKALLRRDWAQGLSSVISQADVVHVHGLWRPLLAASIRGALTQHKPYVITPHGMLTPWSLAQKRWKKRLALWLGWKNWLEQATCIHTLSDEEASLTSLAPLRINTATVPNGVFSEEFAELAARVQLDAAFPVLANRRYVLFLGRLHTSKGVDVLASAFASVAAGIGDVDLVIAGPDDGLLAQVREIVARLKLTQRVHILGAVFGAQKRALLAHALCLAQPSRQEGFSVTILEALACGTPVVISDQCRFPEVMTSAAGSIVPVEPEAIARQLIAVAQNNDLRRTAGANGRALVERKYTWLRIGAAVVALYATSATTTVAATTHEAANKPA